MDEKSIVADRATIDRYWDGRAQSYRNSVDGELRDNRREAWNNAIDSFTANIVVQAASEGRNVRALDLGCGPGFFCVLFGQRGWDVCAVDASENMLAQARDNIKDASLEGLVAFYHGDVTALPFADDSFDIAICRNITWLMLEPEAAYAEWLRVLRPGGKLLVFDANWYRYLVDQTVDAARHADQDGVVLEGQSEDSKATPDQAKQCEQIAAELPLTPVLRPEWDLGILGRLGASTVRADVDIWKSLWTESEQAFYASSPLFLVEATK